MLQRISAFLRRVFQGLRPASFPRSEQPQSIQMWDVSSQLSISPGEKDLKETGPVAAMPHIARERVTEPYRAVVVRRRRPSERYRELDALLLEIKRDRLLNSDTMLLPTPARRLAQRIYRKLEQEASN